MASARSERIGGQSFPDHDVASEGQGFSMRSSCAPWQSVVRGAMDLCCALPGCRASSRPRQVLQPVRTSFGKRKAISSRTPGTLTAILCLPIDTVSAGYCTSRLHRRADAGFCPIYCTDPRSPKSPRPKLEHMKYDGSIQTHLPHVNHTHTCRMRTRHKPTMHSALNCMALVTYARRISPSSA